MSDEPTRRGMVGWLIRHPFLGASIGAVLLLAAAVALVDRSASNGIQRRIAAIRSRGEPVCAADLLTEYSPLPPDENLTTALIEAAKPIASIVIPGDRADVLPYFGSMEKPPTVETLTPDQLAAADWFLDQNKEIVQNVDRACRLRTGWYEFQWVDPIFNTPFRELVQLRHASRMCLLEVLAAAGAQDGSRAGEWLKNAFRCAHVFDENRSIPSLVISYRQLIAEAAETRTVDVINHCGMPPEFLVALQAELEHWCHPTKLAEAVMVERVNFLGIWSTARKTPVSLFDVDRWTPAKRFKNVRVGLDAYAELIAALKRPEDEVFSAFKSWNVATIIPADCAASKMIVEMTSMWISREFRFIAQSRALQTAIACERFRVAQGRWPSGLSELVPEYMNAVPVDLFDGKPLRYEVTAEGIKVWSIGPDVRDDGGDLTPLPSSKAATLGSGDLPKDAGWLIRSPALR